MYRNHPPPPDALSGAVSLSPDALRQLVESGILAPSGDNMQPWVLKWDGSRLLLSIDPMRDRSLYNYRYRASLIALGALIENIVVAAREQRLATNVTLSPDGELLLSAALEFASTKVEPDPLFASIPRRCTNRKAYQPTPLGPDVLESLRRSIPSDGLSTLDFVEDVGQRRIVARAASLNDRLLFEIGALHDGLFDCVRWTEDEANRTRDGLFVKTLELGATGPGFKAMRSWNLVRVLNKIGASRTAPLHSFQVFMRSATFGFLQMTDDTREARVEGGRRMQRIWLTATSLGISFQPMVGTLYLLQYLGSDAEDLIGPAQRSLLEGAKSLFKQVFRLEESSVPILLFRLGYGPPPSATSLRRSKA